MAKANWEACYTITHQYELGKDDDPRDPGGRTNDGVIQSEWTRWVREHPNENLPSDVWEASEPSRKELFHTNYWMVVAGDYWPFGLDLTVWDAGVNSGTGRAKQWAQASLGTMLATFNGLANFSTALKDKVPTIKDYNARRLGFLENLRTWEVFGKGWGRRVAGIEAQSVRMALQASGLEAPEVKKKLQHESDEAKTSSAAHKTGAGGTAAGGAAGATQVDYSYLIPDIIIGALLIGVLLFFIWWAYHHSQRAQAYAQAAASI